MQQGWIRLHRKIRDNPIFNEPELLRLWLICLTEASHKEREQLIGKQTVHLMPGEFVTGRFDILEMYNSGLRPSAKVKEGKTVYRWLEILEKCEFLSLKKTNKFTVVSIDNWSLYQGKDAENDQENDQQMTNKKPTNDQQMTTNNNVKNDNNVNNDISKKDIEKKSNKKTKTQETYEIYLGIINSYTSNAELQEALKALLDMRLKEKTFTTHALDLIIKTLEKCTKEVGGNDETRVALVNRAVERGWKTIYPLQQNNQKANGKRDNFSSYEGQRQNKDPNYIDNIEKQITDKNNSQEEESGEDILNKLKSGKY